MKLPSVKSVCQPRLSAEIRRDALSNVPVILFLPPGEAPAFCRAGFLSASVFQLHHSEKATVTVMVIITISRLSTSQVLKEPSAYHQVDLIWRSDLLCTAFASHTPVCQPGSWVTNVSSDEGMAAGSGTSLGHEECRASGGLRAINMGINIRSGPWQPVAERRNTAGSHRRPAHRRYTG